MEQAAEALDKTAGHAMRVVACAMLLFGEITLSGCGNDQTATSSQASTSSDVSTQTVYNLVPWDRGPQVNASYIGIRYFPSSNSVSYDPLVGTFVVVSETPLSDHGIVRYRVVEFHAVAPADTFTSFMGISAEASSLGVIELDKDTGLIMELDLPIQGEMEHLTLYEPDHSQYSYEKGRLLLRGVNLRASLDYPKRGSPRIGIWADPES